MKLYPLRNWTAPTPRNQCTRFMVYKKGGTPARRVSGNLVDYCKTDCDEMPFKEAWAKLRDLFKMP